MDTPNENKAATEQPKTDAPKTEAQAPASEAPKQAQADAGTTVNREARADAGAPAQRKASTDTSKSKGPAAKGGTAAKAKAAEQTPARRESKIAPIQEKVVGLLKKGSMTVQAMAKKLDCTERNIRQAIDRARAQGEKINRVERNTFGYEKPKRT